MPVKISNEQPHPKGGRVGAHISFYTGSMTDLVEVVCGDAWLELRSGDVQNLSSQSTDLAHRLLRLNVQNIDLVPAETVLARWYARFGPVRALYGLGEGALGRQWIYGPDRTGEGECGKWIVQSSIWAWLEVKHKDQ